EGHLARPQQRARSATYPAAQRRRGPYRLQDQARLLRMGRRLDRQGTRALRARDPQVPGDLPRGRDSVRAAPSSSYARKLVASCCRPPDLRIGAQLGQMNDEGAISDRLPPDQGERKDQAHAHLVAPLTDTAPATRPAYDHSKGPDGAQAPVPERDMARRDR